MQHPLPLMLCLQEALGSLLRPEPVGVLEPAGQEPQQLVPEQGHQVGHHLLLAVRLQVLALDWVPWAVQSQPLPRGQLVQFVALLPEPW